jgi:hypothetical protein
MNGTRPDTIPPVEELLPAAARALEGELGRRPGELTVVSASQRSYSHTWELRSASGAYILKWVPLRAEREVELARLCRTVFAGEPSVRTPGVACNPTRETFLVEKLDGVPLQDVCTAPPLVGLDSWVRSRSRLLAHVGAWLRNFHGASTPSAPSPLTGVQAYVANREAAFEALDQDLADEFRRVLDSAVSLGPVRAHGDFTPHNILVSGDTIAVIDFAGISELEVETRCFDAGAMIVGLEESWRFRRRNYLRFSPAGVNRMIAAFLQASGVAEDDRPLPICYAVRHLTRIYNVVRKTGKKPGPRHWHVQRLRLALERPDEIRKLARAI